MKVAGGENSPPHGQRPTNREVETDGFVVHRVRDGKIVEYWSIVGVARVMQQLGVMPGAPG
jgi:ketosteroid isomerase-like protein